MAGRMMKRTKPARSGGEVDTGDLTIGALAQATRIPVQTLRTWERRYGAPLPYRKPSGHRVYSLASVEHLRKVAELLDAGHRPAEVLPLSLARLDALLALSGPRAVAPRAMGAKAPRTPGAPGPAIAEMLTAVFEFDREALMGMLRANWSKLGPLPFLQDCAGAFMAEVGARWGAGSLEVRHEHFATACLADLLREVREPFDRQARGPRVIGAVLSGDLHEGGLLVASVLLALRGYRVVYLGLDTPNAEVVGAAREAGVYAVMVSVSAAMKGARSAKAIASLRKALPRRVHVWVGGAGAPAVAKGCVRFDSLEAMDQALASDAK